MTLPFPQTQFEFHEMFATNEHCWQYLYILTYPQGFYCPECGNNKAYRLQRYNMQLTKDFIKANGDIRTLK